jgi:iron complex outermembrane receptor protein
MNKLLLCLIFYGSAFIVNAQNRQVTGVVTSADGSPVPGANVVVKGSTSGTVTDVDGKFSFSVAPEATTLVVSFIGYVTQDVAIPSSNNVAVVLVYSSEELQEVVVSVGRGAQRTFTDTPLPVDNFTARDLVSTGQPSFDKALQYRVPSFNTVNTPVNDATTLLDPYEIRNLGPSRLLVLINGKRKNLSSLLMVQFAPGRGETGVDLSGIPTQAIKRVEILRDGASAQYGSDAIAGVMNVILKDRFEYTSLNVTSGVTSQGDGGMYGLALNSGANIGRGGFINYTLELKQQDNAVRSGTIDPLTEVATFGSYDPTLSSQANLNNNPNIVNFLKINPTGGNINGTGATSSMKFLANFAIPTSETGQFYGNAAFVTKKVISNANYRVPYWKVDYGLLHTTDPNGVNYTGDNTLNANGVELYKGYVGYMPTFEGDLKDYNSTLGIRNETNGWHHDASITVGGNEQTYSVNNTVNHSLGAKGPTSYKPGGYNFKHVVGNIDLNKTVAPNFNIGIGAEARSETYQIIAGDTASYSGQGANSFPGIRAENARTNSRFNMGGYFDATWDITDKFLIQGTVRAERYSDFGNAFVWKVSSRYKLLEDKLVIRGSVSTGFRAPTLHQIYAQSTQASFAGGTIVLSGLFNNNSKEAFALGIPKLKAENSLNYTFGLGLTPVDNLSVTVDYYDITISDRIVYSSSISTSDPTSQLGQILTAGSLSSVQFFINGIKTNTKGLDVVAHYKNLSIGEGKLGVNLAGNFVLANDILGSPNDPAAIKSAGATILNTQVKSLLTEGRPQYKAILGLDYSLGKFNVVLNNTLFGPTKFQDLDNGSSYGGLGVSAATDLTRNVMQDIKQEFSPAVVTDLNVGYSFTKNLSFSFTINNLFNVVPTWKLVAQNSEGQKVLDDATAKQLIEGFLEFSGRYRILGYNGSQFSQLGTTYYGQLTFKF